MKKVTLIKIFACIFILSVTLSLYIEKQNQLTELRLEIPNIMKELKRIQEENIHLQYEINQFESPVHLMELSRKPEYSHLKYPNLNEILILQEGNIPP